jgi:hypothetical protein
MSLTCGLPGDLRQILISRLREGGYGKGAGQSNLIGSLRLYGSGELPMELFMIGEGSDWVDGYLLKREIDVSVAHWDNYQE